MALTKTVQLSFSGGEISPDMYGRKDDTRYQNGLARCRNFICLPQGPIRNRPGFEFVSECGIENKPVRVIPFTYSAGQTMIVELGDKYAKFHSYGATLIDDDESHYQIETPWAAEDLFDLVYVQSGDIVTFTSEKYPPTELRRYGARDWRIQTVQINTKLATPTGVKAERVTEASDDPNKDKYTMKYRVSCLNADKTEESEASGIVEVVANLYSYGTTVKISCNTVEGASFYRFYKNQGGLYGYIGDSETPEIIDDNITPKTDVTIRRFDDPFADSNYPRAVGYYEQRRIFGGLATDPQRVLMTKSGTESDMSYSLPYRDDDRISFQIASREFNAIQHVVSLSNLLLLTVGMGFRISPQDGSVITPDSITAKPQSNEGASRVMPQILNNSAIYCAARGGHVRELAYQYSAGGYVSNDLCLRSSHLFDFKTIKDSALSRAPIPIVWFVSSDGSLLAQTYIPEQEVNAWSQLVTDGVFESVAAVEEGDEDHLYAVVRREVNGQTRRYIERMASQSVSEIQDSFFVDCGAIYEGEPATTISGLTWLEGKTVSILADGAVMPQQVVTDGKVILDHQASKVVVGLPYTSDAQTLPVMMQDSSLGSGRMKNVTQVYLRVYKSSGVFAGPSFEERDLAEYKQRTTESPGSPPALYTGELELRLFPAWQDSGAICVRQSDPLPLTIQSAVLTVST